jgi:predicted ArsR family transcriptional regulator
MEIPPIEQVKIQAQVLVPLVKALRAELGEERANALVRKALGGLYRKAGEDWWRGHQGDLTEKMAPIVEMFAAGEALDYQPLTQTPDTFEFNITGCRYAQFYRELGEPELGFLLVCYQDVPLAEGFGPEVEFRRTQTIMQGASHCDFRFKLKQAAAGKQP